MRSRVGLLVVGIMLVGQVVAWAAEPPVAVSPGDASKVAVIADQCPTFSWAGGEEAKSYELVVYRVGTGGEEAEAVLRQDLPAPAYSWTPSLDSCLERGGRYAWSVRAVGRKEASDWSPPSLFEVVSGPSEEEFQAALQVVRRYLGPSELAGASGSSEGSSDGVGSPEESAPAAARNASAAGVRPGPSTRSPGPITTGLSIDDNIMVSTPDTPTLRLHQDGSGSFDAYTWDIAGNETNFFVRDESTGLIPFKIRPGAPADSLVVQASGQATVDGSAVVTLATLSTALCESRGLRYLDQGDGTVLDCNTDLLWLKDASCADLGSSGGRATWQTAKDEVDDLRSGMCGLTDGSQPGHWRLPGIGELCSRDSPTPIGGFCPPEDSETSLLNTGFSSPAISNSRGTLGWGIDGDAFVGVQPAFTYWSSTEDTADGGNAWAVWSDTGEVISISKSSLPYIWPVRDP